MYKIVTKLLQYCVRKAQVDILTQVKNFLSINIKFLRRLNGFTQTQLGKKLDISRGNIAPFESGVVQPNSSTFLKISALFHVHPVQLIEVNLSKRMPDTLLVNEDKLGIKDQYMFDHLKTFIENTNQLTKILEGYQVFDKLRSRNINDDPTGLTTIYHDLLDLFEMSLKNNWTLISSLGLDDEEEE